MRRYLVYIMALATIVFSASTCEKMEPGDYHDYLGNKINLIGPWVLAEVQVKTAGVIETHRYNPESVMEFAPKGQGYTKDMFGDVLDTWHYETYRAAVTIFTSEEWENNQGLGEDDSQYEQGKTYYFHVVDEDTISSEEKVSSNTYTVYFYTRYVPSLLIKDTTEEMYSPSAASGGGISTSARPSRSSIKGSHHGTFLPQVAEETGWDTEEFLGHCARDKAGIGYYGWKDAKLYTYQTEVVNESDL